MKALEKAVIFMLLILSMAYAQNKLSVGIALHREKSFTPEPTLSSGENTRNYGDGGAIHAYLQYEPTQRFFIRTGFGFGETIQKSSVNNLTFPNFLDPRTGLPNPLYIENDITTGFLEIPLDFGWRLPIKTGKFAFLAGAGASFHINTSNTQGITVVGASVPPEEIDPVLKFSTPEPRNSDLSLRVFTGIEFQANKRMFFALEPYARYSPNRVSLDYFTGKETGMWDVGFTLRLRRK